MALELDILLILDKGYISLFIYDFFADYPAVQWHPLKIHPPLRPYKHLK